MLKRVWDDKELGNNSSNFECVEVICMFIGVLIMKCLNVFLKVFRYGNIIFCFVFKIFFMKDVWLFKSVLEIRYFCDCGDF